MTTDHATLIAIHDLPEVDITAILDRDLEINDTALRTLKGSTCTYGRYHNRWQVWSPAGGEEVWTFPVSGHARWVATSGITDFPLAIRYLRSRGWRGTVTNAPAAGNDAVEIREALAMPANGADYENGTVIYKPGTLAYQFQWKTGPQVLSNSHATPPEILWSYGEHTPGKLLGYVASPAPSAPQGPAIPAPTPATTVPPAIPAPAPTREAVVRDLQVLLEAANAAVAIAADACVDAETAFREAKAAAESLATALRALDAPEKPAAAPAPIARRDPKASPVRGDRWKDFYCDREYHVIAIDDAAVTLAWCDDEKQVAWHPRTTREGFVGAWPHDPYVGFFPSAVSA